MESTSVVTALAALAQDTRLQIFRSLVRAGPGGLPAGAIADAVGTPASTLSFHLKELANAGLANARQEGRFVYYSANYSTMSEVVAYLTAHCCQGAQPRQVRRRA
jgi:ArsR family transcriptional regulator, arsenate/arsenite/antimonite-responsive transcriptional repressor